MKRVLLIALLVPSMIVACKKEVPTYVEGQVTETHSVLQTDPKRVATDVHNNITLTTADGKSYELELSKLQRELYPGDVARLKKMDDGTYAAREIALLNYDHGTPAFYEFQSDHKPSGFFQKQ